MFLGVEASFREIEGVLQTAVGYTGGSTTEPTYEQVCAGTTGHAEAVEVWFDPAIVSYGDLLRTIWSIHAPHHPGPAGLGLRQSVPLGDLLPRRRAGAAGGRVTRRAAGIPKPADRDRVLTTWICLGARWRTAREAPLRLVERDPV